MVHKNNILDSIKNLEKYVEKLEEISKTTENIGNIDIPSRFKCLKTKLAEFHTILEKEKIKKIHTKVFHDIIEKAYGSAYVSPFLSISFFEFIAEELKKISENLNKLCEQERDEGRTLYMEVGTGDRTENLTDAIIKEFIDDCIKRGISGKIKVNINPDKK